MQAEGERGDDAEVAAAAAAQRPQQIGVRMRIDGAQMAVGGHDLRTDDAVARESEMAAGEAHPTTERVPADADRRARPGRDRRAVRRQGGVDVDQLRAGADRGGSVRAVDADLAEVAQVEHDAALQRRVSRVTVTSRPRPNRHAARDRPADRRLHVGCVDRARHRTRQDRVKALVVDVRGLGEARRARFEHAAADRLLEGSRDRACKRPAP